MAITTTTISRAAGWARTDAIGQMGEALSWLEWHGGAISGLVTFTTYSGGGTVGSSSSDYYCVNQTSTDGSGTGSQFRVDRTGGSVSAVYVNDGGSGYAEGDQITLKADDIGGSANGAADLVLTVKVDGGASPVSYGSTTDFFSKGVTDLSSYPYGIQKHVIGAGKTYGTTYRGYQMYDDTQMYFHTGSGFNPYEESSTYDGGPGYVPRHAGEYRLDVPAVNILSTGIRFLDSYNVGGSVHSMTAIKIADDKNYQLDLNIFRSALDPKFAVFSYRQPTLSSTILDDNTFLTFILHNFTTDIWDLDYLFLGGHTRIFPESALPDTTPLLTFRSYIQGEADPSSYYASIRCAEWGYSSSNGGAYSSVRYKDSYYSSTSSLTHDGNSYKYNNIYNRNNIGGNGTGIANGCRGRGGIMNDIKIPDAANYNAVIKGIPLSTGMVPCPYYIPDDFVLIDFSYDYPNANIQQWDTVTISGSEIYTVITGSYSNATKTQGILFCARTT